MKRYKIIKAEWDKDYEKAEVAMNEMSEKGWEVVSALPDPHHPLKFIIIFCRDDSAN